MKPKATAPLIRPAITLKALSSVIRSGYRQAESSAAH